MTTLDRRTMLRSGGLATGLLLMGAGSAGSAGTPESSYRSWESLNAFTGVCAKTGSTAPWNRQDDLYAAMRTLGVSWMRTNEISGRADELSFYGSRGIKIQAIAGKPTDATGPEPEIAQIVSGGLVPYMIAVEGANEWNLSERPGWGAELAAHHARVYRAVKSTPELRALDVVAPSMAMMKDYEQLGLMVPFTTLGNIHCYPGGHVPEQKAGKSVQGAAINCGELPSVVTETGWHTAQNWTEGHYPTPEDVARVYAPRTIFTYFELGVQRMSFYQLADAGTTDDKEDHFGLVDFNLRPKQQFAAIANTLSVIRRGGASGSVSVLNRTVTGPADLHTGVVKSAAGRYLMAVWRDVAIYVPESKKRLSPAPASVTINWGTARRVAIFNPANSAAQIGETGGSSTTLRVAGELLILDISA